MPLHNVLFRKIALLLVTVTLAFMPAPMRVSCVLPASPAAPQPLPEPCDPVLLSSGGVSVSASAHDIALAILAIVAPSFMGLLWHGLPDQRIIVRTFYPIPDPPPPRSFAT